MNWVDRLFLSTGMLVFISFAAFLDIVSIYTGAGCFGSVTFAVILLLIKAAGIIDWCIKRKKLYKPTTVVELGPVDE